jgi:hypothetical protein
MAALRKLFPPNLHADKDNHYRHRAGGVGPVATMAYGNGLTCTYIYDQDYRETGIAPDYSAPPATPRSRA